MVHRDLYLVIRFFVAAWETQGGVQRLTIQSNCKFLMCYNVNQRDFLVASFLNTVQLPCKNAADWAKTALSQDGGLVDVPQKGFCKQLLAGGAAILNGVLQLSVLALSMSALPSSSKRTASA